MFIHGYMGDPRETWDQFPTLLATDPDVADWDVYSLGYHTSAVPDLLRGLWAAEAPIPRLGRMLVTFGGIPPLSTYGALAIVAHSMGGLVTQHALLDPDFRARVQKVVLFGTPSAGLFKALIVRLFKRQLRDMGRYSRTIRTLRRRWKKEIGDTPPFLFWAVAGDRDEFVTPGSSLKPFKSGRVVNGNHLSMVKPADRAHPSYQLVKTALIHGAEPVSRYESARVAVELGEHRRAIELLGSHPAELDEAALVTLALALDSVGRSAEAEKVLLDREAQLRQSGGQSKGVATDLLGTLAGRIKRRWLVERRRKDAERALALYRDAYRRCSAPPEHHEQAYYHAINVAFLELYYRRDHRKAAEWASTALRHCEAGLEGITGPDPDPLWRNATRGEAALHLGRTEEALAAYRRALDVRPPPKQWERLSMYTQARRIAESTRNGAAVEALDRMFCGTERGA